MAQYIVHKDTNRGGYRSYTKNADRLKRYDSLVEARAQAVKQWKKSGDSSTWFMIERVTPREKGWYGDSGWNYEVLGYVYGHFARYSKTEDKNYFNYFYVTWGREKEHGDFKKNLDPRAKPVEIEITENGQTIKKSLNPAVASAYNRKKKDMPFGL